MTDINNTPFIDDFLIALSSVLEDYEDIRVVDYSKITYSEHEETDGSNTLSTTFATKGCLAPNSYIHRDGSSYYFRFKTPTTTDNETKTITRCEGIFCAEHIGSNLIGWDFGRAMQFVIQLSPNTEYTLKITLYSNSASWYIKDSSSSSFTNFATSYYDTSIFNYPICIGCSQWGNHLGNPFKGEIYLDDCYAEDSNGNEFWRATNN